MLLTERVHGKMQIVESDRSKLPETVLCRVTYPICNIDEMNANRRIYEKAVWERVLANEELQEKLANRNLYGHAEHPLETQSDLRETSHIIHEMWIDENDGKVYQTVDVLDTPMGRIVDCLLRADSRVGMSTRAEGDLEEAEDDRGKFHRVVPGAYQYKTTDFTADPSTFNVAPMNVKRNVKEAVEREMGNLQEGDKRLAEAILNSVSVKESDITLADMIKNGHLKEGDKLQYGDHSATVKSIDETNISLSVEKDGATSDVQIQGDTVVGIDPEGIVSVVPVAMEPEMPLMDEPMEPEMPEEEPVEPEIPDAGLPDEEPGPGPDFDAEEELENGDYEGMGPDVGEEEEEDELGESKDSSENVEESQEKDEQSEAGDVNDSEAPVSDVAENVREVTELKVKEASVRAERDKALEELHTLQHVKQANESHQRVRSKLMQRNEVLRAEVAGLRSVLEAKAQTANESVAQLTEAKSKLDGIEAKLSGLEEDHKAEMKDKCNESFLEGKIAVLSEYFDQRLRESRLKVHKNVQALLGDCVTLLDVDELIERLTKAKRRDALHSERVTEIAVRKQDLETDGVQKRVDEEVGEIFDGFGF
jgi:hypothetical protein